MRARPLTPLPRPVPVGGPLRSRLLRLRIKIAPFNDRLPLCDLLIWAASPPLSNYGSHAVSRPNLSRQQIPPRKIGAVPVPVWSQVPGMCDNCLAK